MRIIAEESLALVIDIQDRLLPHMHDHEQLISNTRILLKGLHALEIPFLVTEQYRKGLGQTNTQVSEIIQTFNPMEKMTFSCCDHKEINHEIQNSGRKNIIICGIEAHVCVLQTVIDLAHQGYQPVVVEDCVSSRKTNDKEIAIHRMRHEGAIVSTYESILFELTRVSGTETFKDISRLVK